MLETIYPTKDEAVRTAVRELLTYRDVTEETLRRIAETEFDVMEGEHGGFGDYTIWLKCSARMYLENIKSSLRRMDA